MKFRCLYYTQHGKMSAPVNCGMLHMCSVTPREITKKTIQTNIFEGISIESNYKSKNV